MPRVELSETICTPQELAGVLGISDRRVRQLTSENVLKCVRGKRYRYRLADSLQRFVKYQCALTEAKADGSNGEYELARTRRMNAVAEESELELQAKRGKL